MASSLTVLIAARNAEATIARAVRSAMTQPDVPILLVDDGSTDRTVGMALDVAGSRLRVVKPDRHRGVGQARQIGLECLETPYGMWLDADDELLPGRADRFLAALEHGDTDIVSDAAELADGTTGKVVGILPMPSFMMHVRPLARLFERNYLPCAGTFAFRSAIARAVGYDATLTHAEDTDFMLRAIVAAARVALLEQPGYRLHAYPQSLSRQRAMHRGMYRRALLKHEFQTVRACFSSAGYSARITEWGLVSFATYREDYDRALAFLDNLETAATDPRQVLEPDGPWPFPEGWRISFARGTLLLLSRQSELALPHLERSYSFRACAESANNLGVALWLNGRPVDAERCFADALERFPGYADARENFANPAARQITSHPLRVVPSRNEYDVRPITSSPQPSS